MNKKYTPEELEKLRTSIIKRTVATRVPMSSTENAFVNADGAPFAQRVKMADAICANAGTDVPTLVKSFGDIADRSDAVDEFIHRVTGAVGDARPGAGLLSTALQEAGFKLGTKSTIENIPFTTAAGYRFKTPTLGGGTDIEDVQPIRVDVAPLGFDERFLAPYLDQQGINFTDTAVQDFSQLSRNLGNAADGIRTIGAVTAKPEVGDMFKVGSLETKQIAWKQSGIPNILFEMNNVRTFIDYDLRMAFARSVDKHVIDSIMAASPATSATGANELEQILYAMEVVKTKGHVPNLLAASPTDWLAIDLLRQPGTDDYVAGAMDRLLSGIQRVEIPGMTAALLMDTRAVGTFFQSSVRLQAFEENDGSTNTQLVRCEATGVFRVERIDAVVNITPGFGS